MQSSLRFCTQTNWRTSGAESFAVKTLAERVRHHRVEVKKMSVTAYAALVGTSRQNIDNVESGQAKQPRYIGKLAKAMGVSVDELLRSAPAIEAPALSPVAREQEAQYTVGAASLDPQEAELLDLYRKLRTRGQAASVLSFVRWRYLETAQDAPADDGVRIARVPSVSLTSLPPELGALAEALAATPPGEERARRYIAALQQLQPPIKLEIRGGKKPLNVKPPVAQPEPAPAPAQAPAPSGKARSRT